VVLASAVDAAAATGTITQLSFGSATDQQNQPAVAGTNVVWTGASIPAGGGAVNFDIFYYDINNPTSGVNLTQTPTDQEFLEDIDGNNVVWTHTSSLIPGDIVVYDLSTNKSAVVASSSQTVHFAEPSIRGQWLTFLKINTLPQQPQQIDVYLYDNFNQAPVGNVTLDAWDQGHPRVGGGIVVFEDFANGLSNSDVLGWTIPSGPSFAIATGPNNQVSPDVDGNTVVWVETIAGGDQIFAWDIAGQVGHQLTNSTSNKVLPRISGSRVVWSDDRNGSLDLYYYDLAANQELPLVTGAGDQFLSDIDGNRVVYTDNSAGFEQVFLYTFGDATPPPPDLPPGCDPALTDAVGAPASIDRKTARPVYTQGSFKPEAGKTYYVCVENGLADGSERTTQMSFEVGHEIVLNPSDFRPLNDPPHFVAAVLPVDAKCNGNHGNDKGHGHHCDCDADGDVEWAAALFGPKPPNHVTVTIRVSK
jgi:beta propeller repeat protein